MIRQMLRRCALGVLAFTEIPAEPRPVRSASEQIFEHHGQALVEERRAASKPVIAGTVHLLGLDDIKRDFGAKWSKASARVMDLAERVIRGHLTDSDIYTPQGDETFVLFFAQKSAAEGEEIARLISAEIKEVLAGALPSVAQAIEVDHFVAEIPDDVVFEDVRERPLAGLLLNSLAEIRAEAERTLNQRRAGLVREARVVFRPVWNPHKRAVMLFRCMLDATSGAAVIDRLAAISEPDQLQSATAELDLLVFGKAIQSLHDLLQRGAKVIVLVPVNFHTFAQKSSRDEYLRICQELPEAYRKFIFFELYGVPAGAPGSRIEQICSSLGGCCHGVVLQVTKANRAVNYMMISGIAGISLDVTDTAADHVVWMKRAVTIARSKNLLSLLHGANRISLLQLGMSDGFDYIDGEAVHVSLDAPKGAFKFTPPALKDDFLAHAVST